MPRIKMTDKGGFTVKGDGVDIDTPGKFARSNEGCIQGWVFPISGSVASAEIIVGASGAGQSDAAANGDRAPYDGSNVIDMTNFVRAGNVVKINVYVAIKDETGTASNVTVRLKASESKYHTYNADSLQANTIMAVDIASPPEFASVEFVQFIYNTDNLNSVQLLGHSMDKLAGNDPDVEVIDGDMDAWDSVTKPYWHICVDISGTENSSNFWGMKVTVDTEFIGKRTD